MGIIVFFVQKQRAVTSNERKEIIKKCYREMVQYLPLKIKLSISDFLSESPS